ncbi:hypothetical protein EZS27_001259 [termite gut metagenome]|uniref:Endonuclease/exonuclease/phosphatase domain-containing protein n=1 Tax=termite gut metagenome TaxID=433724 RepID=A0A5J4T1W5_9ZZZZ
MNKYSIVLLALVSLLSVSCSKKAADLKVLQLNVWMQATMLPNAAQGVIDIIDQTDPDVVFLCELNAGTEPPFTNYLAEELRSRGKNYYADTHHAGNGILSKYELVNDPEPNLNLTYAVKSSIKVNNRTVVLYSAHLDAGNYAAYLTRGYSPSAWSVQLETPVTDTDSIQKYSRLSKRNEGIEAVIADAKAEISQGHIVLIGGDFNEPSHLDWQADTKDLRDHRGVTFDWEVSTMLQQAGYIDSYRSLYPDAVTHPAITWPAGNKDAKLERLYYAPKADEQDRIDFIYYYPQAGVSVADACIVGPKATINHGQMVTDDTQDNILEPTGVWSSDHKGNLVTLVINK